MALQIELVLAESRRSIAEMRQDPDAGPRHARRVVNAGRAPPR
jgi:hypothetical protein